MAGFSFLSRFVFICNIFFLICLFINLFMVFDQADKLGLLAGIIIVMGMILAPILNMGLNLWFIMLLLSRKQITVGKFFTGFNFIVLVIQIIYYLN